MITKRQADALMKKIERFRDAELEQSWSRGGDPDDWDEADAEQIRAKKDLEKYIAKISTSRT